MIEIGGNGRLWLLSGRHSSYALHLTDEDVLLHLHWGPRLTVPDAEALAAEPLPAERGFESPLDGREEYPVEGGPRFVRPALSVRAAGVRGTEWRFESSTVDGDELRLRFHDPLHHLDITLHYRMRDDGDVIERWTTLTHTRDHTGAPHDEPLELLRADSAAWSLPAGDRRRLSHLYGRWAAESRLARTDLTPGEKVIGSRRGHTSHQHLPWIAIDDGTATEESGEVHSCALAWSGSWRIAVQRLADGTVQTVGGVGHDEAGLLLLAPGESFTTPVFAGLWTDGGFGAASRGWHAWQLAHVVPGADRERPVLYNSWEAVAFDVEEEGQLEIARKAADLGVELFVMDDGWFGRRVDSSAGLGDWWPNPERFPEGLDRLADEVRRLGMGFGVWVEPEMVNPDSDLYRTHPDWVLHHPHRRRDEVRTQLVLNFAREDVREWALGWLDKLVGDHGITFLKWDMNRAFSQAGWPAREKDGDGDQDRLWIDHTRNVYAVMDRLRANHPDLRIESCAGGGGRVDFGILARTDEVWTSDNTDAFHRQSIQHGFSQVYPAGVMAAWVTDAGRAPLAYRFHVAMAGVLGIGGNLHQWSPEDIAEARELVARYKDIRATVQHGEQYRLGAEPGRGLSAIQYVYGDEVAVLLFHPHPEVRPAPGLLRLAGLDADAVYQEYTGADAAGPKATGRVLMSVGLPIRDRLAPGDWASALVRLRPAR